MDHAIPRFSEGYRALLAELAAADADNEALYVALDQLRTGIERATVELGQARAAAGSD
jgi:hypothetical protein